MPWDNHHMHIHLTIATFHLAWFFVGCASSYSLKDTNKTMSCIKRQWSDNELCELKAFQLDYNSKLKICRLGLILMTCDGGTLKLIIWIKTCIWKPKKYYTGTYIWKKKEYNNAPERKKYYYTQNALGKISATCLSLEGVTVEDVNFKRKEYEQ